MIFSDHRKWGAAAPRRLSLAVTLAATALLTSCTDESHPAPHPGTRTTAANSGTGWENYAAAAKCDANSSPVVAPPTPVVTASVAVDDCRLLIASTDGLTAVTGDGALIALDRLNDLNSADRVAIGGDTIWVAGTSRQRRPALIRFTNGERTVVALPRDIDTIGPIAADKESLIASVTTRGRSKLLRVIESVEMLGELPGEPAALTLTDGAFFTAVVTRDGLNLLTGHIRKWQVESLGRNVGVRGIASGKFLAAAVNELVEGVPVGALFLTSTDSGRTWSRHRLPGAEVGSIAVSGTQIYAAMTRAGESGTVFRSPDGKRWQAVPIDTKSESLPELTAENTTVWLVGDVITNLNQ